MPDTENNLTDNDILDLLKHSEFSQRSIKRSIEELEHVGYLSKIVKRPSKHIIVDEFFDF
ncbi:hypothetical protein GCM10011510_15660 [Streptococcus himalayensis]|uniref:Uncharacterized protein n=3 Tax=Streptococcus himalayensis TaxID=1888195 RepID=A0A917EHD5_9STRE|nr:hypothetical protein GCM10011510_15660 [Streptococcus himalayensis]